MFGFLKKHAEIIAVAILAAILVVAGIVLISHGLGANGG